MRRLLVLLACCLALDLRAEPVSEYDMKAIYLYNFASYTEWPFWGRANFNFCVLGDDELGNALSRLESKKINGMRVVVARLTSLVAIRQCQVLYLPGKQHANLRRIQSELGELPVLTVGEAGSEAEVGVVLRLEGARLVFDLNLGAFQRAGLKPQETLVRLARNVRK